MNDWFYQHPMHGLCLTFRAMTDCGVSENTLWSASLRGTKKLPMVEHPEDKRRKLILWNKYLGEDYKQKITAKLGTEPQEYISKQPIRDMVAFDLKAESFYMERELPMEHVKKYATAASWLNLLLKSNEDKKQVKKQLNMTIDEFYTNVLQIIVSDCIDLPTSYSRLKLKIKDYQAKGYECLIDWRFGNKLAAKVTDEVSESVLLELIAHPNQHDDVMVCSVYNTWAVDNGYKPITPGAVGVHRKANEYKLMGQRKGNSAWYEKYGKVIHRQRPTAPLLMIGSDDNDLDLYFMELYTEGGKNKKNPYFRYKLIVVMDAYNDYILGYSFGDEVTIKLIKAAYLDAVYHIKELTGGWYLPHQIQTDRWGVDAGLTTDLARFYQSMATYTPATVKLARSKYIERAFGTQWHQQLKFYPNYAGTNITSKTRTNRDNIELLKSGFPTKEEGVVQIEDFINRMRSLTNKDGITKQVQWLTAFNADERSQEKMISDKKMLLLFGTKHIVPNHKYPEFPNRITKNGIEATINGRQIIYDVPDQYYLENVDKRVQIMYEPYNYARVLVTDGHSLHFIAHEFNKAPAALADFKTGDRTRLNNYLQEKLAHTLLIAAERQKREYGRSQSEGLLQSGDLRKEQRQMAEAVYQRTRISNGSPREMAIQQNEDDAWEQAQQAYRDTSTDINEYLNL